VPPRHPTFLRQSNFRTRRGRPPIDHSLIQMPHRPRVTYRNLAPRWDVSLQSSRTASSPQRFTESDEERSR
jgi:hypothetical protein